MLALIVGVITIGVSYVGEMSKNVQNMSVAIVQLNGSINQLNSKMSDVYDTVKDHESRLRSIEHTKK